jgi:hypothetical protein
MPQVEKPHRLGRENPTPDENQSREVQGSSSMCPSFDLCPRLCPGGELRAITTDRSCYNILILLVPVVGFEPTTA